MAASHSVPDVAALLEHESRDGQWYAGTAEQLIAAGLLKPEQLPPVGRGSATFHDGRPVGAGGRLKGCEGMGLRRVPQDDKYLKVVRKANGTFRVFKGSTFTADSGRSSPAFRRFMDRTIGHVDEYGRCNEPSIARNLPREQWSDELLLWLARGWVEKACGRDSPEADLLKLIEHRQYKDRLARRAQLEQGSQAGSR